MDLDPIFFILVFLIFEKALRICLVSSKRVPIWGSRSAGTGTVLEYSEDPEHRTPWLSNTQRGALLGNNKQILSDLASRNKVFHATYFT